MRIAIVTETFLPATDGVVTRLVNAVDYMLDEGHEVLIIAPKMKDMPASYRQAKIIAAGSITVPFYSQRPWSLPSLKVKKWLKEFQPDIVHAVNPISIAASGVYYAKKLKLPLIASFHTNIPNYLKHYKLTFLDKPLWTYLRKLHNSAKINLVTSKAMHDLLDEHGINGLQILPKGVNTESRHTKFKSEAMRQRLSNGKSDNKLLIFVGRIAPEKEIGYIRPLLDLRDDISLAIVGDGPNKDELEKQFAGTHTVFTGFLHGNELSQAFASADAFIFPSTSETLGLVITEAMASGVPVIAAASEPTVEQISHEENGFVFDKDKPETLLECLEALENDALIEQIKHNGRQYAEQFSWENASKAMLDAYYATIEDAKKMQD